MYKHKFLGVVFLMVFALLVGGVISGVGEEEPRHGGTLIFPCPYGGSVGTLDPAHTGRTQDTIVLREIFETLVQIDEKSLEIKPLLAKSWDISDDGLNYTFHLKKGVKFHDGTKFTAKDVKYTFERIMDPKEAAMSTNLLMPIKGAKQFNQGEANSISGIRIIDDHTIRITLEERSPYFLHNLAVPYVGMVSEKAVDKWGNRFSNHPVGTGPFEFDQWRRGSFISLKAFDEYHMEGLPYLDQVKFKVAPESGARVAAFKAGDLDFDTVTVSMYKNYKESEEYGKLLLTAAELYTREITFNLSLDRLKDVRVRKAFNYAIDKEKLVEELLAGKAITATGWLPSSLPAFNPDLEGYEYDPKKAKTLMEEAGYNKNDPLKLTIIGTNDPSWGIPVVEAATPYLEKVGFEVEPELVDGSTLNTKQSQGNFEAAIWSLGGVASPIRYLKSYFYSGTSRMAGNYSGYDNPDFDKYLEQAMKEADFEKRMKLLQKAEEVLVKDPPVWFFNYNKAVGIHQPWVHGVVGNAREMAWQPLEKVWIDEESPRS